MTHSPEGHNSPKSTFTQEQRQAIAEAFICLNALNRDGFHVFLKISPHCKLIEIDVHEDGWVRGELPTHGVDLYFSVSEDPLERLSQEVRKIERMSQQKRDVALIPADLAGKVAGLAVAQAGGIA